MVKAWLIFLGMSFSIGIATAARAIVTQPRTNGECGRAATLTGSARTAQPSPGLTRAGLHFESDFQKQTMLDNGENCILPILDRSQ